METYFFHAILSAQRNRTSLAVLLIDLDDFKPVNDTYGHEAGDRLLVRVAGALQDAIRNTDFLVRLGGDEFVILLEGLHKTDDLLPVLDNIYKAVVTPFMLEAEIKVSVGCSARLALYPDDSATPDGLLRHADEALYVAKRNKQIRPQYWVNYLDILAAEKIRLDSGSGRAKFLPGTLLSLPDEFLIKGVIQFLGQLEHLAKNERVGIVGLGAQPKASQSVKTVGTVYRINQGLTLVSLVNGDKHFRRQGVFQRVVLGSL